MKRSFRQALWLLPVLFLAGGCLSIDYVGQEMPELPDYASVYIFKIGMEYPQTEYKIIGRAEYTVPVGYSDVDLYEKALDDARSRGADAIKVVSVQKRPVDSIYRQPTVDPGPEPYSRSADTATDDAGRPLTYDSFGKEIRMGGSGEKRFEEVYRTLYLVRADRYAEIMAERQKTRDKLRQIESDNR